MRKCVFYLAVALASAANAAGVAGSPPADDGRAAYLPRPWREQAVCDRAASAYEVWAGDQRVPLYTADVDGGVRGGDYLFASFPLAAPLTVRIRSRGNLAGVRIRPERAGLVPQTVGEREVLLRLDRPMRLALEGAGAPLLLFADPPEREVPRPGDRGVVWFGPGYHEVGKIALGSNETLYLAPGAVVSGGVEMRGTNIVLRGRGILDGRAYRRFHGPTAQMVDAFGCRGVRVEGLTFRNPYNWALSFLDCEDVAVENVKVCGGRMINDDAVDICNCRRFTLRNSFFRCADDVFAIKGNLPFGAQMTAVEDVLIEDCEAWTDAANVFRIGFECNATRFRGICARRIDVLHCSANFREVAHEWANCAFYLQPANDMTMEDILLEDIRIRAEGPLALFSAYCHAWGCRCRPYETAGRLRNVVLRNVSVTGATRAQVLLRGESPTCDIAGVTFEKCSVNGVPLRADSPDTAIGPFARAITFK